MNRFSLAILTLALAAAPIAVSHKPQPQKHPAR